MIYYGFPIFTKNVTKCRIFLSPKRCQNHYDLNRFHTFWADYMSVYWGKLANYHVMENELRDLINFLSFQPKCPFRWKIQLVPSCCGITLKLPEIALQKELYESFLMRRCARTTRSSKYHVLNSDFAFKVRFQVWIWGLASGS